jgi:hypothetical protein
MINFHITAENAPDFESQFTGLANLMGLFRPTQAPVSGPIQGEVAPVIAINTGETQVTEAAAEAPRRTRRTKAQIEADAAAQTKQSQAEEGAPTGEGKPEEPLTQTSSSESETSTQNESSSSAGDPPADNTPGVSDADAPTVEELRAWAGPMVQSTPGFREKLSATLKKLNAKAISELDAAGRITFADDLGYVA